MHLIMLTFRSHCTLVFSVLSWRIWTSHTVFPFCLLYTYCCWLDYFLILCPHPPVCLLLGNFNFFLQQLPRSLKQYIHSDEINFKWHLLMSWNDQCLHFHQLSHNCIIYTFTDCLQASTLYLCIWSLCTSHEHITTTIIVVTLNHKVVDVHRHKLKMAMIYLSV